MTNTYRINMKTPLGERKGTLTVEKNGELLSGYLDILRHREPFAGTVDETGNCRIAGVFITLIRRVSYVATGRISDASLCLQVKEGRNTFELQGEVCSESEAGMEEESN